MHRCVNGECANTAVYWSSACRLKLCTSCWALVHVGILANTTKRPLDESWEECEVEGHRGNPVDYYCRQCDEFCCEECLKELHAGHTVQSATDEAEHVIGCLQAEEIQLSETLNQQQHCTEVVYELIETVPSLIEKQKQAAIEITQDVVEDVTVSVATSSANIDKLAVEMIDGIMINMDAAIGVENVFCATDDFGAPAIEQQVSACTLSELACVVSECEIVVETLHTAAARKASPKLKSWTMRHGASSANIQEFRSSCLIFPREWVFSVDDGDQSWIEAQAASTSTAVSSCAFALASLYWFAAPNDPATLHAFSSLPAGNDRPTISAISESLRWTTARLLRHYTSAVCNNCTLRRHLNVRHRNRPSLAQAVHTSIADCFENASSIPDPHQWAVVRLIKTTMVEFGFPFEGSAFSGKPEDCPLDSLFIRVASKYGALDFACWLLRMGANFEVKDTVGQAPMHIAAQNGHAAIVRLLIQKGADVDIADHSGFTPLHLAAVEGNAGVVQLLLDAGVSLSARHPAGQTALDFAAEGKCPQLVEILLKAGAIANVGSHRLSQLLFSALKHRSVAVAAAFARTAVNAGMQPKDAEYALTCVQWRFIRDLLSDDGDVHSCEEIIRLLEPLVPLPHTADDDDIAIEEDTYELEALRAIASSMPLEQQYELYPRMMPYDTLVSWSTTYRGHWLGRVAMLKKYDLDANPQLQGEFWELQQEIARRLSPHPGIAEVSHLHVSEALV